MYKTILIALELSAFFIWIPVLDLFMPLLCWVLITLHHDKQAWISYVLMQSSNWSKVGCLLSVHERIKPTIHAIIVPPLIFLISHEACAGARTDSQGSNKTGK